MNNWDPRVNELFMQAIELSDPAERAALLDRLGDADLRRRVEALLKAHDEAGGFLREPHPAAADDQTKAYVEPSRPNERPGTVVAGRYKLLEPIGEGGMGTVWVAEQTEPVRRKVALKLIKAGMDSKSVLARFEAERQALAVMDHPNIAKVLDGGVTESGRPFFVMEYVKGVPITEYCDAKRLSVPERLTLFAQVCQAVQHAHQKGIIHRDLKPSNILVAPYDDRPVPKVIDFGLAKAMHQSLTERTLHTAHETVLGTPLYMSPEQAQLNNLDVDTRSDVYSLGVLLYELLTGSTPLEKQRFKEAAWDEVKRIIREEEPPRPSTRLSSSNALASLAAGRQIEPTRLTNLLRGELDWIVMKALEKDRTRRYETANGFAADVLRYLAGEPVQAHPPSASYKLKKFVRRNRGQVIAATLVLFALIAGVIGTTVGLLEARRQTRIAREQEAEAKKQEGLARDEAAAKELARAEEAVQRKRAVEFRDKALEALRATTGTDVEQLIGGKQELGANEKAYLEAIAKRWQAFAQQEGSDEQSRAIRAEGCHRVAHLWDKLGRREEARPKYEQAMAIWEKLASDFPAEPIYRSKLATSHNNLGGLLAELGKRAEAEEQFGIALEIQEKLAADLPAVPEYRRALSGSHYNLGTLLASLGKWAEAEKQYKNALVTRKKLTTDFPSAPEYRLDLATSHNNLGGLLAELGKRAEAEDQYGKALVIQERLAADFPAVPEHRSDLALSHSNFGALLGELGKRAEANEQHKHALAIREKLVADFPTVPDFRRDLALTHNNLGALLADFGKHAEAEGQYKQGLIIQEKLAADFPAVPDYRRDLALSHNNLGNLLAALGKRAEAEEQYKKGLAILEKLVADFRAVPDYRRELARSHNSLGNLLAALGKWAEAEEQHKHALAIREKLAADFPTVPNYRVDLGGSYLNCGSMVRDEGRIDESLGWFDKAIATLAPIHCAEPRDLVAKHYFRNSHWGRAMANDQLQKYTEAVKDWDRAVELSPPVEQIGFRARRARSRLRAGMVAEEVAEVGELTKSSNWNASQWYDFACVYSVASGKLTDKKQEYAGRAMELLAKAVKAGYKDAAHMKADTDLDVLRSREDFKKLLAQMEATSASMKNSANAKQPKK